MTRAGSKDAAIRRELLRNPHFSNREVARTVVELDAMKPDDLIPIVRAALEATIADQVAWDAGQQQERAERQWLREFVREHWAEIDGEDA